MKSLIIGFLILVSVSSVDAGITPGTTVPTLTACGRVFTDLTNLIILYGSVVTAGHWTTLRKAGATSGYTPSGSKAFKTVCVTGACDTNSANCGMRLVYGDTDVGLDGASAPTNPKYIAGDSTFEVSFAPIGSTTSPQLTPINSYIDFVLPNTKFLAVGQTAAQRSIVYGYEQ